MRVGLEVVPDCITGQFWWAAQLIKTLTGKEAATVWFTHVRPNPNVSQDPGASDANEGLIGVIQSAITAAVEAAMRTAVNELVTTLDERISQQLQERDQLFPSMSAAPQMAAAGATQGSNNSTTSGMLCTNTGNIGLPVGGIAPSIMPLPVFSSPGGAASSPRASTVPPTATTTGGTLSPSSAVASVMPAPPQLPSSEAIVVGGSSPPPSPTQDCRKIMEAGVG